MSTVHAPAIVLGPELAGTMMTPKEFDAIEQYDENYRYELIHGVDRFRRTMTVVLNHSGKQQEKIVTENEIYRTPRLPGFELPLKRLFSVADEWQ